MLVGWNSLTGQLTTQPISLFRKYNSQTGRQASQRRSHATQAPSYDHDIAVRFGHASPARPRKQTASQARTNKVTTSH
jgi:hypothetical protein